MTDVKIGKYNIIGRLGVGSMGVVYKAIDPEIGRTVAIKTIKGLNDNPELLERFKIEARSAGNLKHPNIITLFEVNTEPPEPFMVMDYIDGVTLASVLEAVGHLDSKLTFYYADQIAKALDAVHKKSILHKDIKPANIMISNEHHIYILDFGVATVTNAMAFFEITREKDALMGTPGYMSPEQILNQDPDFRSDLFSFAIMLYEMLSGKRPFKGKDYKEVFETIVKDPPTSITEYGNFPLSLDAVFMKALAKDKTQRYQTAKEFVQAAKEALEISVLQEPVKSLRELSQAIRRQTKEFSADEFKKEEKKGTDNIKEFFEEFDHSGEVDISKINKTSWNEAVLQALRNTKILVLIIFCLVLIIGIFFINRSSLNKVTDNENNNLATNTTEIPQSTESKQVVKETKPVFLPNKTRDELIELLKKEDGENWIILALEELNQRKVGIDFKELENLSNHTSHLIRVSAIRYAINVDISLYKKLIISAINDYDPLVRLKTVEFLKDKKDSDLEYELQKRLGVETIPQVKGKIEDVLR